MKNRIGFCAFIPLALFVSSQAAAEQEEPQPQDETALELPDDITGAELAEKFQEILGEPEFDGLIDDLKAEALKVGEPEPGWNKRGVYLPDLLASRDGGLAGYILSSQDGEFASIQQFGVASATIPGGLHSYRLIELDPDPVTEILVIRLTKNTWLEVLSSVDRVGNAACYRPEFGVTVHSKVKANEWNIAEFGVIGMFVAIAPAATELEVCLVYSLRDDGTVTSAGYTRDGEPYLLLNAEEQRFEIRPASESAERIETLRPPPLGEFTEETSAVE